MKLFNGFKWFLNPVWIMDNFFTLKIDFGDDTPAPQQNTTVTTNIPDYAQSYVENMLGATQKQLFNTTTDAQGNTSISGIKPYQPYSTNMNDYVAGFSPMQQQAQQQAGNLSLPGQYGQANQFATASGLGSLGTATTAAGAGNQYMQMAQDPNAIKSFMNPYLQQTLDPALAELRRQYGITGTQQQSAATGAGAFGGSREALMAAENQRNLGQAQGQLIGSAYDKAFQQAQQAQQYGAGLGLQGQQAALQGYGQAGQAASTLGSLGGQELAGQQSIIGTQNQIGAQQTAAEQAKINQAIQDYATAQQYPLMQLGVMSNMTRGLPLSAPTTSMYQAQPTVGTQALGALGATTSLANAAPKAAGGILSINKYDVGGAVESKLSRMPTNKLNELKKTAQSEVEKDKIDQILRDRGPDGMPEFAPGGIIAFADGNLATAGSRGDMDVGSMYESDLDKAMAEKQYQADLAKKPDTTPSLMLSPKTSPQQYDVNALARNVGPGGYDRTLESPVMTAAEQAKAAPAAAAAPATTPQVSLDQLLAKYMGPASSSNKGLPATGAPAAADDMETKLQKTISDRESIDQKLADGLDSIYRDPVNAPYAKARFNQFQSEIDNAGEKERQMFWLHSATMFATMATQPGGVVKAAMGALANEIPLYVKDKDKADEHLDTIKKAQYDITQSEIARRVGDLKTSLDLKDKALKEAADIYIAINKDKTEKAKLAEEARFHDISGKAQTINAISNLYQAQKEPNELAVLRGINKDKDLKDLYLGKTAEAGYQKALDAWIKDPSSATNVPEWVKSPDDFRTWYEGKSNALNVDDKTVSLVSQYLNNAKK